MGADDFIKTAKGKTVKEAFELATQDARYDHGHASYTGTIAEKHSYTLFTLPEGIKLRDVIDACVDWEAAKLQVLGFTAREAERIVGTYNDKWGPACAVEVEPGTFKFFGIASS